MKIELGSITVAAGFRDGIRHLTETAFDGRTDQMPPGSHML
ncbi:MAG: hypothetical protein ACLR6J_14230 [Parabacteroides merdae]